jgi:ArsR family transcriptional regulator, virulence genes transcriptional regulator
MSLSSKEIEDLGKGIGNSSRWQIIQVLLKGECTVNHIVKSVKMSQSVVSQHLKTLKSCNLVSAERKGQEIYYSLNTKYTIELLKNLLTDVSKCPSKK